MYGFISRGVVGGCCVVRDMMCRWGLLNISGAVGDDAGFSVGEMVVAFTAARGDADGVEEVLGIGLVYLSLMACFDSGLWLCTARRRWKERRGER